MLHTKFRKIGPLVPKKKVLKVYNIYGHGGDRAHVTSIMFINFHFHVKLTYKI